MRYPPLASLCPQGPPPLLDHPSSACQIMSLTNVCQMNEAVSLKTQIISPQSKARRRVGARMRFESSKERNTVIREVKLGAPGSSEACGEWEKLPRPRWTLKESLPRARYVSCSAGLRVVFIPLPCWTVSSVKAGTRPWPVRTSPVLSTVRRRPGNASEITSLSSDA